MIARLRGTVSTVTDTGLVVDVGGVGYEVTVAPAKLTEFQPEQTVTLLTYHHIREQSQELFGFESQDEKSFFEQLINISGVGPKSALSVLSLGKLADIRGAIAAQNAGFIARAQGIGKKSAERIVVELKDKLGEFAELGLQSADISQDAHEALVALGYSSAQAASALKAVDNTASAEDQVKQALRKIK